MLDDPGGSVVPDDRIEHGGRRQGVVGQPLESFGVGLDAADAAIGEHRDRRAHDAE